MGGQGDRGGKARSSGASERWREGWRWVTVGGGRLKGETGEGRGRKPQGAYEVEGRTEEELKQVGESEEVKKDEWERLVEEVGVSQGCRNRERVKEREEASQGGFRREGR